MSEKKDGYTAEDRMTALSSKLGIHIPEIFLPSDKTEPSNWPVIACNQYTASPAYWDRVQKRVEGSASPSAYNIILPEIYLEEPGDVPVRERIAQINRTMRDYYSEQVISSRGRCMVFTDRSTPYTPSRKGLVFAIDLEKYDFSSGSKALIRATEGTVLERIPPRLQIRKDAGLEISHVMLLADDPGDTVIGPVAADCAAGNAEILYDIQLPEGGVHVRGYRIPYESGITMDALEAMSGLRSFVEDGLLFAVGDGNHSLATAKTHWDNIKSSCPSDHPSRYALVELVNIYDEGLRFEPIHRVVFGVKPEEFAAFAKNRMPAELGIETSDGMSVDNAILMASTIDPKVQPFIAFTKDHAAVITCNLPLSPFTAGTAQLIIDSYISSHPSARVDYIHGEDHTRELADRGTGILLPALHKEEFFGIIAGRGCLPRKTFSMGEADEKRFYMECRLIV